MVLPENSYNLKNWASIADYSRISSCSPDAIEQNIEQGHIHAVHYSRYFIHPDEIIRAAIARRDVDTPFFDSLQASSIDDVVDGPTKTIADISLAVGKHPDTIRTKIRRGLIKAHRQNRRTWQIYEADALDAIEGYRRHGKFLPDGFCKWRTILELREETGVAINTVIKALHEGRLSGLIYDHQNRRQWLIPPQEFEAFADIYNRTGHVIDTRYTGWGTSTELHKRTGYRLRSIKEGLLSGEIIGRKIPLNEGGQEIWIIPPQEFDRIVTDYEHTGFLIPREYAGWRSISELVRETGICRKRIRKAINDGEVKGVAANIGNKKLFLVPPDTFNSLVWQMSSRGFITGPQFYDWIPTRTIADELEVTQATVRNHIRAGDLCGKVILTGFGPSPNMMLVEPESYNQFKKRYDNGKKLIETGISVQEFSQQSKVAPATIRRLIHEGTIDAEKIRKKDVCSTGGQGYIFAIQRPTRDMPSQRMPYIRRMTEGAANIRLEKTLDLIRKKQVTCVDRGVTEQIVWRLVRKQHPGAFEYIKALYQQTISEEANQRGYGVDNETKIARALLGLWEEIMSEKPGSNLEVRATTAIISSIKDCIKEERGPFNEISLNKKYLNSSNEIAELGDIMGLF